MKVIGSLGILIAAVLAVAAYNHHSMAKDLRSSRSAAVRGGFISHVVSDLADEAGAAQAEDDMSKKLAIGAAVIGLVGLGLIGSASNQK